MTEVELRKAFESLNRLGDGYFHANPTLDIDWIEGDRQLLTQGHVDVDPGALWKLVQEDAPRLLRRVVRATVPK